MKEFTPQDVFEFVSKRCPQCSSLSNSVDGDMFSYRCGSVWKRKFTDAKKINGCPENMHRQDCFPEQVDHYMWVE